MSKDAFYFAELIHVLVDGGKIRRVDSKSSHVYIDSWGDLKRFSQAHGSVNFSPKKEDLSTKVWEVYIAD